MSGLDVAGANHAFAILLQLQNDRVATVQLEDDTLEVEQDIDDVFLHAVKRGVLVQNAVDRHFGRGIALHRGKQDAAQRVAERVTVAAFERLHHDLGLHRRDALHVDDAGFQKSSLHVLSFALWGRRVCDYFEYSSTTRTFVDRRRQFATLRDSLEGAPCRS